MIRILTTAGLAGMFVLSACVPRAAPPPPRPARPTPMPVRTPTPAPVPPPSADWRDWALTPGTWRYVADARGSRATYGSLTLVCDRRANAIRLTRADASANSLVVRTSTSDRTLAAQASAGGAEAVLGANDRLLDAMGFSRGRFVVETPGAPPLVVPAWAEVLRVVEDCRG